MWIHIKLIWYHTLYMNIFQTILLLYDKIEVGFYLGEIIQINGLDKEANKTGATKARLTSRPTKGSTIRKNLSRKTTTKRYSTVIRWKVSAKRMCIFYENCEEKEIEMKVKKF